MGANAEHLVPAGVFDEVVVVLRDIGGAVNDRLDIENLVEDFGGVGVNVTDDVSIAAAMDGLVKGPGLNPYFELWQGSQRK